jgi:hypothetical protein
MPVAATAELKPLKKISQKILTDIQKRRAALATAETELKALEARVFAALKAEAKLEPGLFIATVRVSERRSPKWREVAEREIDAIRGEGEGFKFAERVLAATKPSVSEKLEIVVAGL